MSASLERVPSSNKCPPLTTQNWTSASGAHSSKYGILALPVFCIKSIYPCSGWGWATLPTQLNFFKKLKNEKKSEPTALLLFINFSYAYFRQFYAIIVPGSPELWTFHRTYLRWAILPTHIIHTFLPHWKSPYISSI